LLLLCKAFEGGHFRKLNFLFFKPRITQRGSAATEEDPPNDAKKRERFRVRGQKPGISPFLASFWRVWRIISFRHWGRQNGRVKKSSQNAMNLPYSSTDHLDNKNPFPIGLRSENLRLFRLPTRWLLS
jgi:hypothetical protein